MRKVIVYSSKGQRKSYETEASTWGELKQLIEFDYDLSNLQATENINKTTLEHVDAKLPEGDFVLFLRPIHQKAGYDFDTMSFRELRNMLDDDIKNHLSNLYPSKSWTQLSTNELREGLESYYSDDKPSYNNPIVTEVEEPFGETVMPETGDVKESILVILDEVTEKIEEVKGLLVAYIGNNVEKVNEAVDTLDEEFEDLLKGFE